MLRIHLDARQGAIAPNCGTGFRALNADVQRLGLEANIFGSSTGTLTEDIIGNKK